MVSLLPTKFHEILFCSFRGVSLTNCVTDRTKTICLPTKVEGDIIQLMTFHKVDTLIYQPEEVMFTDANG